MLAVGMAATGGGGAVFDVFSSQQNKIFQTTNTHKHNKAETGGFWLKAPLRLALSIYS